MGFQGAGGHLERIETDTDRDGRVDKWQDYAPPKAPGGAPVLRAVSMDPDATGKSTRRLHYRADGSFDRSETLTNPSRKPDL